MVAEVTEYEDEDVRVILTATFQLIRQAVLANASVALPNIGTIQTYVGKPTRTKDPQTNKIVKIPARRRVRFTAAKTLSVDVRES